MVNTMADQNQLSSIGLMESKMRRPVSVQLIMKKKSALTKSKTASLNILVRCTSGLRSPRQIQRTNAIDLFLQWSQPLKMILGRFKLKWHQKDLYHFMAGL